MANLKQRLDRLEKEFIAVGGATCRLCYGTPIAAVHVMYDEDPDGLGMRKTGDRYLLPGYEDRITDDLCCRRCGTPAVRMNLISWVGLGVDDWGRKLPPEEPADQ